MKIFQTSYCNRGHRLEDGVPIDHECYVLPPRALELESNDRIREAMSLIQDDQAHLKRHAGARSPRSKPSL